ncbi:hypothetical protein D0Z67_29240 (plasmid) [Streptomyces seoulensis]|uniref:Uncharacterized protein n=1 Tax=Streptomyces seoulensis TaxID=73044 RepID=A0A4V1A0G0_STRSO|nr:hypothetical protein D0Z67_29240 [Streptomyces seoulensis]
MAKIALMSAVVMSLRLVQQEQRAVAEQVAPQSSHVQGGQSPQCSDGKRSVGVPSGSGFVAPQPLQARIGGVMSSGSRCFRRSFPRRWGTMASRT